MRAFSAEPKLLTQNEHTNLCEAAEACPFPALAPMGLRDGTDLWLDGFEHRDVHQCDLTLQENRDTGLEAFKQTLETQKSYVFMGYHVKVEHL